MTDPAPHTPPSTEDEPQGEARADTVLEANSRDLERGRESGISTALLDRLKLD
ncbi:UNVERIFIED_CONTAM: hypothetical protein GN151_15645, partial [Acinetobacter sp. HSTU-ASm16]